MLNALDVRKVSGALLPPLRSPVRAATTPSMTITRDDLLRVATLARLDLDEDAVDDLVRDLDRIVGYVTKLDELDTSEVPPTAQVAVSAAPLRPDQAHPGVPTEVALREAPRSTAEGFRVPAFVDES